MSGGSCDWHSAPNDRDWLNAAYHEAGHAISLVQFGMPFRPINLNCSKGEALGQTVINANLDRGHQFAITALAGPVAEAKYSGIEATKILCHGGRNDFLMAMDSRPSEIPPPLLMQQTKQLVNRHWPRITKLAHYLVWSRSRSLSYDQIVQIVQR